MMNRLWNYLDVRVWQCLACNHAQSLQEGTSSGMGTLCTQNMSLPKLRVPASARMTCVCSCGRCGCSVSSEQRQATVATVAGPICCYTIVDEPGRSDCNLLFLLPLPLLINCALLVACYHCDPCRR